MSDISLGAIIYTSVKPIIKIYLGIGIGFFLAKRNVLTVETGRNVSDIILNVLMPCLMFNKIITSLQGSDIKDLGIVVLSAFLYYAIGLVGGIITVLLFPVPKNWKGGLIGCATWNNIGDLPMAYMQSMDTGLVFTSAEGNKGLAYSSMYLTMLAFTLFNMGGYRLVEYDFRDVLKGPQNDEEKSLDDIEDSDNENNHNDKSDDHLQLQDRNSILSTSSDESTNSVMPSYAEKNSNKKEEKLYEEFLKERGVLKKKSGNSSSESGNLGALNLPSGSNISRSNTNNSIISSNKLAKTYSKNLELRDLPSQTVHDLIDEYSQAENLQTAASTGLERRLTKISTLGPVAVNEPIEPQSKYSKFIKDHNLGLLDMIIVNFLKPQAVAVVIAITITMIPWVRRLFTVTSINMPDAPDELPILNFLMDITSFIGQASVPFGILMLGATMARIKLGTYTWNYYLILAIIAILKLAILPIISIAFVSSLRSAGWIEDSNHVLMFVMIISSALPSATTMVYLTAFYTLPGQKHEQLDLIGLNLLIQYPMAIITLPIVCSYTLKAVLNL